ncbi:MAG: CBS domain-containing protein [Jiangellales bacterium]
MHARDHLDSGPVVSRDADALQVVTDLVHHHWDGLVVVDDSLAPLATVSLDQVLRLSLPDYIEDDVSLASVYAERDADTFAETLRGRTVGEVTPWPRRRHAPVTVSPDDTLLEVAAVMAVHFTAIVAVVDDGRTIGALGALAVMAATLPR